MLRDNGGKKNEQIIIFGQGAIRMSAANLKADVEAVNKEIGEIIR